MAGFVGVFLLGVFMAHPKIVFAFFDFISERIPALRTPPPPPPPHVPQSKRGYPHVLCSRIYPDETPPGGFASSYVYVRIEVSTFSVRVCFCARVRLHVPLRVPVLVRLCVHIYMYMCT